MLAALDPVLAVLVLAVVYGFIVGRRRRPDSGNFHPRRDLDELLWFSFRLESIFVIVPAA